jgi:o-succinylbenzoate synthase
MLRANYSKYVLHFNLPAGTSRGVLHQKVTWFVKICDMANPSVWGLGECAVFAGLSQDDKPEYENKLKHCCEQINNEELLNATLPDWPSIRFGFETAFFDLKNEGKRILFPSQFTQGIDGIPMNGLIWMGTPDFINQQVKDKLDAGFRCLKFKVGALSFFEEIEMLRQLRNRFHPSELEIRLDANGAFGATDVFEKLNQFARFTIHSIEQPIKAGNPGLLSEVCRLSPIPVALDEELIGINKPEEKKNLLEMVKPQYIIVKPALTGGFSGASEWICLAKDLHIGWWITSALESNVGLNAIAQWTYTLKSEMTQGLGTGSLYSNNIPSPLVCRDQKIFLDPQKTWDTSIIN